MFPNYKCVCSRLKHSLSLYNLFNNIRHVCYHFSCFKYLGLWFDASLNWKKHVDCISKKILQHIGVQSRIRLFISTATANTLFKTIIAPIMDYGDIVWSKGPQSNLKQLQKLQKTKRAESFYAAGSELTYQSCIAHSDG